MITSKLFNLPRSLHALIFGVAVFFMSTTSAWCDDSLEGLIRSADSALGKRNEGSPASKTKSAAPAKTTKQAAPAATTPATTPADSPAPTAPQKEDPAEATRREELSRIFAIENEKREETPTIERFGIDFGLNLGTEISGGLGMTSKYVHDEDMFAVSRAQPLLGGEFSAEKSLLDMFGIRDAVWVKKSGIEFVGRAALALFQADLQVQQSGIQNREITVTHRLLRSHLAIVAKHNISENVSAGAGLGLGFASLNQAGLGVSDTFFTTSYPAFTELQLAYAVSPDLAVVGGVRKFGFTVKSEDTSNSLAGFLGVVMGL